MDSCIDQDCAVCLQKCHHPTKLPCGHIFCFLCVKGVAIQSKKCAMCRADIPSDYLDHPVLLEKLTTDRTTEEDVAESYQWYYEGRNGWWKYDERSNEELERSFNASETECTLLLAGSLYIIDFESMIQMRRNNHSRRRRVKRDTPLLPAKGIAGIKILDTDHNETKMETTTDDDTSNDNTSDSVSGHLEDNNTTETEDVVQALSSLRLQSSQSSHTEEED